jgi:hypothetical protein
MEVLTAMGVAGGCQTGGSAVAATVQSGRVHVYDGDVTHQLGQQRGQPWMT